MSKFTPIGLPWKSTKNTDVSDCKYAADVIRKSRLDFTVKLGNLFGRTPYQINGNNTVDEEDGEFSRNGDIYRPISGAKFTYRTDTGQPLGLVGDKYTPIQNISAFEFFDNAIDTEDIYWETAGYLGVGERIYISAKFKEPLRIGQDIIHNYLIFTNSHDGTNSLSILFSPVRVACCNALASAFAQADATIRFKHTKNIHTKLDAAAVVMKQAIDHTVKIKDLYSYINSKKFTDDMAVEIFAQAILSKEEFDTIKSNKDANYYFNEIAKKDYCTLERLGISKQKGDTIRLINRYYHENETQTSIEGTGWGVYNAITGYYSNIADNGISDSRIRKLLFGTSAKAIATNLYNVYKLAEKASAA